VIGGDAVHVFGRGADATKKVAASDNEADLHIPLGHLGDLGRQAVQTLLIDTKTSTAGENLAAQLEQDSTVLRHVD